MRPTRRAGLGAVALLLATGALATAAGSAPAAADAAGSRAAVEAKKKCKKGFVRRKQTCVRKRTAPAVPPPAAPAGPGPAAPAWDDGRWRGSYAENGVELLFNVSGGQLYTGGFDSFFIHAACSDGSFDPSAISPVRATIAASGDFAGSGVYSPGFGQQIPWQLSGHLAGKAITAGTFTAGPYTDFFGNTCGGTTHVTGQWIAAYTF